MTEDQRTPKEDFEKFKEALRRKKSITIFKGKLPIYIHSNKKARVLQTIGRVSVLILVLLTFSEIRYLFWSIYLTTVSFIGAGILLTGFIILTLNRELFAFVIFLVFFIILSIFIWVIDFGIIEVLIWVSGVIFLILSPVGGIIEIYYRVNPPPAKFCSKCGKPTFENSEFCGECGSSVVQHPDNESGDFSTTSES